MRCNAVTIVLAPSGRRTQAKDPLQLLVNRQAPWLVTPIGLADLDGIAEIEHMAVPRMAVARAAPAMSAKEPLRIRERAFRPRRPPKSVRCNLSAVLADWRHAHAVHHAPRKT